MTETSQLFRVPLRPCGRLCFSLLCGLALTAGAADKPVVFVSIPPQAWLVKRLAGEAVEVQTLLTPGANPHTFEPDARQMRKLAKASLWLTLGMPFETVLAERVKGLNAALAVAGMDAGIVKLGAAGHAHDDEAGHACGAGGDPHIWLSPRLMCAMASNTVTALRGLLPQRVEPLAGQLRETVAEIQGVDASVRDKLAALRLKTWVVYHPSWGYFARDYGLVLLVIEQEGRAPAAKHLAEVIRQARDAGIRVVFAERQYDPRPTQVLAQQLGARVETVDPLQEAWPALMVGVAEKLAGGDVR